jgi:hypothetical protein
MAKDEMPGLSKVSDVMKYRNTERTSTQESGLPQSDPLSSSDRGELLKVEGHKDDAGFPRFDLIAPEPELALATILEFGARKYTDRNWELGMKWGRVYRALKSHLNKWQRGHHGDDESGYSHLWHAYCCLHFLLTYEARGLGEDDIRSSENVQTAEDF